MSAKVPTIQTAITLTRQLAPARPYFRTSAR